MADERELLKQVSEMALKNHYIPEFAQEKTEKKLREALGVAIAVYCDCDGGNIVEVFLSALEDANYHTLGGMIEDYCKEHGIIS